MPSSLAHYETFLINNVSTISTLESSLRSLTWFLPGRFKDAELASEALSVLLNSTSMYHDTLLAKLVYSDPKYRPLIPTSLHTRFTRAWSDKSSLYKWAARSLELIRFAELFVEMALKRKVSQRNKWRGIVLLEIIKAALRFILMRVSGKPLVSPPIPERDIDPTSLPSPSSNASSPTLAPSSLGPSPLTTPEHLKNNYIPLPPHPLLTAPPPPTRLDTPSLSLIRSLSSPKDWLSESIYVLRPLIYATLLSFDRRSNRPLVVALALELIARNLRRVPPPSAALERSEYARRDRDMLWYLFRGSIWDSYTRPKLEALADRTAHTPILGLLSAFVKDWIPLINEYHYYTAP
ncbi:Peroxisomal membrane protein PEX16 [Pleurotus pulmonarius]